MSQNRRSAKAGWIHNEKQLLRGPNGRPCCRQCGNEIPPGRRRTFCSDQCVTNWKITTDPTFVRIKIYERDKGICAICGVDTVELVKELGKLEPPDTPRWKSRWLYEKEVYQNKALLDRLKELGISEHRWIHRHNYGIWDADHIVPVIEGGGEAPDLGAYRTLCCQCHREETAKLKRRLAEKKRSCKQETEPKTQEN